MFVSVVNKRGNMNDVICAQSTSQPIPVTFIGRISRYFTQDILYLFMFYFGISPIVFSFNRHAVLFMFVYTSILFLLYKKKIGVELLIVSCYWILVNTLAFSNSTTYFEQLPEAAYTVLMVIWMAYMIISILGKTMFIKFESLFYWLSLISLPLFVLENVYRPIFLRMNPVFRAITGDEMFRAGGWYGGFYTFNAWAHRRNSGFMWEPGGFAFILIFAMIIRLSMNGFRIDKHIFVYFICLATTLSTAGFVVASMIVIIILFQRSKHLYPILMIPIVIYLFINIVWELDFMGGKIETYFRSIDRTWQRSTALRVNRFGIFYYAWIESFNNPLGYGAFPVKGFYEQFGSSISGPNTLAYVLVEWGWLGLIAYSYAIKKAIRTFFQNVNITLVVMLSICIWLMLFSNPRNYNIFVLSFLFLPFIDRNRTFISRL